MNTKYNAIFAIIVVITVGLSIYIQTEVRNNVNIIRGGTMTPLDMRKKFLDGLLQNFVQDKAIEDLREQLRAVKTKEELEIFTKNMNQHMTKLGPINTVNKVSKLAEIGEVEEQLNKLSKTDFNAFIDKQDRARNKKINDLKQRLKQLKDELKDLE